MLHCNVQVCACPLRVKSSLATWLPRNFNGVRSSPDSGHGLRTRRHAPYVPTRECAGYAGKKQEVKVHYDEGLANHIDPESCAVTREGLGEALTGERIGQPSSRGRGMIWGVEGVLFAKGETEGGDKYRVLRN